MPLQPYTFSGFDGLRLDLPIDEVGPEAAIDLCDMDWNPSTGEIETRAGAAQILEVSADLSGLWRHSDELLLGKRGGEELVAMDATGPVVTGETVPEIPGIVWASMGTPSASYSYGAIRLGSWARFDGAAFVSPTVSVDGAAEKSPPLASYLTVWPDGGNRMVLAGTTAAGGPGGASSSQSHVWLSEPGNAEAYEATAYVQLAPGDGEEITGAVTYGGMVFILKRTKMFVFYSVSTDEEGKPEFNFREVTLPSPHFGGASNGGQRAVATATGVYFLCADGVYLTTGGPPSLISGQLEPLASSRALAGPIKNTLGEVRWLDFDQMFHRNGRLYLLSSSAMLVYDIPREAWLVWNSSITSLVSWNQGIGADELYFSSGNGLYRFDPTKDEDPSVPLTPRWQSGFYDMGTADEKALKMTDIWGTGEVELSVAKEFGEVGEATVFQLGVAPEIKRRQHNKSQVGALFSHRLSGKAPWSVQRITRYAEVEREPGSKTN